VEPCDRHNDRAGGEIFSAGSADFRPLSAEQFVERFGRWLRSSEAAQYRWLINRLRRNLW
jgi:hypothetical protein